MNVGILGGTFDPIHSGHLILAEKARLELGLAKVLFVPAGQPWLKADRAITPAPHRVEMVKGAIAANPYYELSTVEVDRSGPSYTVDTIAILQQQLGEEARFFVLLGWDSLAELPRWQDPGRLVKMCQLVAVPRTNFGPPNLEALESSVTGITQSVVWLDMPLVDISSSGIRERVARGLSISRLVPDDVERYIQEQRLYC